MSPAEISAEIHAADLTVGQAAHIAVRVTNTGTRQHTDVELYLHLPTLGDPDSTHHLRIDRLAPGDTKELPVAVRPEQEGVQTVFCQGVQYRDRAGRIRNVPPFSRTLIVRPAPAHSNAQPQPKTAPAPEPAAGNPEPAVAEPSIAIALHTTHFAFGVDADLHGTLRNTGHTGIQAAAITIKGLLNAQNHTGTTIGPISPGGNAAFRMPVRPGQVGTTIAVLIDVEIQDTDGHKHPAQTSRHTVSVAKAPTATPHTTSTSTSTSTSTDTDTTTGKTRVLFLAANPSGTSQVRLGKEQREIKDVIARSTRRDHIEFHEETAVRLRDVSRALLTRPRIVHFAGHGDETGAFLLEADDGTVKHVRPDRLAALFGAAAEGVEAVLVNACFTEPLARALLQHVDHVIGMRREVSDTAAVAFSVGFYQALAEGRTIQTAFDIGKALAAADIGDEDPTADAVPVLYHRLT